MAAWNADGAGAPARTPAPAGAAAVTRTDSTATLAADTATMRVRALGPIGRLENRPEGDAGGRGGRRRASRVMCHKQLIISVSLLDAPCGAMLVTARWPPAREAGGDRWRGRLRCSDDLRRSRRASR